MAIFYKAKTSPASKRNVEKGNAKVSEWQETDTVTTTAGTIWLSMKQAYQAGWNEAHKRTIELLEGRNDPNCKCPECIEVRITIKAVQWQLEAGQDPNYVPYGEDEV